MVPIPIFRAELTVYYRSPDGEWDCRPGGPIPNWFFAPFADDDGSAPLPSGFRRVARGGSRPICTVLAPEGSGLVEVGTTLRLMVPGRKGTLDAFQARLEGLHRRGGFDLVRQIEVTFGPAPEGPPIPTHQMALSFHD